MDYNTDSNRQVLIDIFGDSLERDPNFILLSPDIKMFNCIAYAMGLDDRWVDPSDIPWHWWPPVQKDQNPNSLIKAFEYFGFEACGMDDTIEDAYDKVALYQKDNKWQHAARVVDNNKYHSKFGESYDGTHSNGNVLLLGYGVPYQIMRRLKNDAHLTDERKGIAPGYTETKIIVPIGGYCDNVIIYEGKTFLKHYGNEIVLHKNNTFSILPLR